METNLTIIFSFFSFYFQVRWILKMWNFLLTSSSLFRFFYTTWVMLAWIFKWCLLQFEYKFKYYFLVWIIATEEMHFKWNDYYLKRLFLWSRMFILSMNRKSFGYLLTAYFKVVLAFGYGIWISNTFFNHPNQQHTRSTLHIKSYSLKIKVNTDSVMRINV